jgi:hypothetical protein
MKVRERRVAREREQRRERFREVERDIILELIPRKASSIVVLIFVNGHQNTVMN